MTPPAIGGKDKDIKDLIGGVRNRIDQIYQR